MIGITFTTPQSHKRYVVIEAHSMFDATWKCYPADKEPPYKPNLIDCFSTEFIESATVVCANCRHMLSAIGVGRGLICDLNKLQIHSSQHSCAAHEYKTLKL